MDRQMDRQTDRKIPDAMTCFNIGIDLIFFILTSIPPEDRFQVAWHVVNNGILVVDLIFFILPNIPPEDRFQMPWHVVNIGILVLDLIFLYFT